jgi:hypothetical protein
VSVQSFERLIGSIYPTWFSLFWITNRLLFFFFTLILLLNLSIHLFKSLIKIFLRWFNLIKFNYECQNFLGLNAILNGFLAYIVLEERISATAQSDICADITFALEYVSLATFAIFALCNHIFYLLFIKLVTCYFLINLDYLFIEHFNFFFQVLLNFFYLLRCQFLNLNFSLIRIRILE